MVTELPSYRGDVRHPGRVCKPVAVDITERLRSRLATQIGDGTGGEIYDGLTPVTMTL